MRMDPRETERQLLELSSRMLGLPIHPPEIMQEREDLWNSLLVKYESMDGDGPDIGLDDSADVWAQATLPIPDHSSNLARSREYVAYIASQSELAEEVATQIGPVLASDEEELGDEEAGDTDNEEEEEDYWFLSPRSNGKDVSAREVLYNASPSNQADRSPSSLVGRLTLLSPATSPRVGPRGPVLSPRKERRPKPCRLLYEERNTGQEQKEDEEEDDDNDCDDDDDQFNRSSKLSSQITVHVAANGRNTTAADGANSRPDLQAEAEDRCLECGGPIEDCAENLISDLTGMVESLRSAGVKASYLITCSTCLLNNKEHRDCEQDCPECRQIAQILEARDCWLRRRGNLI